MTPHTAPNVVIRFVCVFFWFEGCHALKKALKSPQKKRHPTLRRIPLRTLFLASSLSLSLTLSLSHCGRERVREREEKERERETERERIGATVRLGRGVDRIRSD